MAGFNIWVWGGSDTSQSLAQGIVGTGVSRAIQARIKNPSQRVKHLSFSRAEAQFLEPGRGTHGLPQPPKLSHTLSSGSLPSFTQSGSWLPLHGSGAPDSSVHPGNLGITDRFFAKQPSLPECLCSCTGLCFEAFPEHVFVTYCPREDSVPWLILLLSLSARSFGT